MIDKEWQEEMRMDAQEAQMEDRRLANRSAEDILEDVAYDFSQNYGDLFEESYRKLINELSDYGLETSADDIFEQVLEDNSGFKSPFIDDNRRMRKLVAQQEAQLNDFADKIYQQAQLIELLEEQLEGNE